MLVHGKFNLPFPSAVSFRTQSLLESRLSCHDQVVSMFNSRCPARLLVVNKTSKTKMYVKGILFFFCSQLNHHKMLRWRNPFCVIYFSDLHSLLKLQTFFLLLLHGKKGVIKKQNRLPCHRHIFYY